jgi:hypothetical protein
VEFVGLSLAVLVPVVYVVVSAVKVEAASFATRQAAREAARAFVTSNGIDQALQRAKAAAALAFAGQGIEATPDVSFRLAGGCDGPPARLLPERIPAGAAVTACIRVRLSLPYLDRAGGVVPLTASHTFVVDTYRPALR